MIRSKIGILVVGHGSSLNYNRELVESYSKKIGDSFDEVRTSFLNINRPTISESLEELLNQDLDKIVVLPLFLAHGVHTLKDIPMAIGFEDGEKRKVVERDGKKVEIIYSEPLGSHDLISKVAIMRIEEALSDNA